VRVQNWEELLPTGKYHGAFKKQVAFKLNPVG